MGSVRTFVVAGMFLAGSGPAWAGADSSTSGHNNVVVPPQPAQPNGAQQQVIVVPPPAGSQPAVVPPQDRPLAVAPCPPAPEPKVVYRTRETARRNPVATVALDAVLGLGAGALVGTGVGLAHGNDSDTRAWQRDIGTGAVAGFFVGAAVGGVMAWVDYARDSDRVSAERVSVRPVVGPGGAGVMVAGRW